MSAVKPYIAHFDLDSFFVSVELLLQPELKDKPMITPRLMFFHQPVEPVNLPPTRMLAGEKHQQGPTIFTL
ncbi:hypothetical protein U0035_11030 [Niabella yanshanensis]|uniref:UmuC domain-containing protein n=1 Tax=Niabella yanshanensis TaxID=577386 RepID=A0ABZ0WD98_9BACT|nr:hypothetical protein [Niabella yanshanensis]WQD40681.1 hypothetical protein U0035_11030 [Niabella yanshanensis]